MKQPVLLRKFFIFMITLFFPGIAEPLCTGLPQMIADPNVMGPGVEYCGMLHMKAGDRISVGIIDIGGFIEVRNEARFNQGLFPNHNWRGFLSGMVSWPIVNLMQTCLYLTGGMEHESSHATMGIVEETDQPYEMIYDHQYRKSLFNAVPIGCELIMYDHLQELILRGSVLWFFLSKNTPEVAGLTTAQSGGFSVSGTYYYSLTNRVRCFGAMHDRFVFEGPEDVTGERFGSGENGPELISGRYSVINQIHTFSVSAGVAMSLFQARRTLNVFVRYLYGHFYGYVDSRDNRSMVSAGILLTGL
jgi:hypothetical protein